MASDDKKTIKFQMMMSPAEAEALDDWGFKRRIKSRAESIRRLCQIGMLYEEEYPEIMKRANDLTHVQSEQLKRISDAFNTGSLIDVYGVFVDARLKIANSVLELFTDIAVKNAMTAPIVDGSNIDADLDTYSLLRDAFKRMNVEVPDDRKQIVELMRAMGGRKGAPKPDTPPGDAEGQS